MNESRPTSPVSHPGQAIHAPQPGHLTGTSDHSGGLSRAVIMPQHKPEESEVSSIELIPDSPDTTSGASKKIRAFGIGEGLTRKNYARPTYANRTGAVRVRSFHGKLSDQGMEYLDNAINDWLEAHPDCEVKFVTSSVGMFDGKIKEPALVLNVWY